MVQGSQKTPDHMDLRIDNLLNLMRKRIVDTEEVKFNDTVHHVLKKIGKKDRSLKYRTNR